MLTYAAVLLVLLNQQSVHDRYQIALINSSGHLWLQFHRMRYPQFHRKNHECLFH